MDRMGKAIYDYISCALGLEVEALDLSVGQMAARAVIVFVFAVGLARAADRRMLGRNAGFDIVLLVALGSVLSRAINGQAAFFPTLVASALLVGLHHVVASVAFRSHGFSQWIKGRPRTLVRNGQIDRDALAKSNLTSDDLDENLRLNGGVDQLHDVAEARLERNGSVSVVKAKRGG